MSLDQFFPPQDKIARVELLSYGLIPDIINIITNYNVNKQWASFIDAVEIANLDKNLNALQLRSSEVRQQKRQFLPINCFSTLTSTCLNIYFCVFFQ